MRSRRRTKARFLLIVLANMAAPFGLLPGSTALAEGPFSVAEQQIPHGQDAAPNAPRTAAQAVEGDNGSRQAPGPGGRR